MNISRTLPCFLLLITACGSGPQSGIDLDNFNLSVRPQDHFYEYVNGTWLQKAVIPADRSTYGSFVVLLDESEQNLRIIIEEAARDKDKQAGSDAQKVGDMYLSYLDTARIESLGLAPIQADLDRIKALSSKEDVVKAMAYLQKVGVEIPFGFSVNQDFKKSDEYISYLSQSGIGLPDRDYYFKEDDNFKAIRQKYVAHMERMFRLAGQPDAAAVASRLMEIETEMAKGHWTRTESRDRDKTYNKYQVTELRKLTPRFDWPLFLEEAGAGSVTGLVVRQPSYFQTLDTIFNLLSIEDWRNYLTWKLLDQTASLLPAEFVKADFDFYRKTLSGVQAMQPRWKRAVTAVENTLGEVLGRLYVARHFKPEAKQRMEQLVENLKSAFKIRLENLTWMSPETKEQALLKLSKFNAKIGYPDKWKDYSKLEVDATDLVGNMKRSSIVEYNRMLGKLGQPVDRGEWFMTPQTVNAYYNPPMNEVVFPAAILQPPFFNMAVDDAANYGGIGAVIGHEISHGFDDQGRKSDGDGNLREWWTQEDEEKFRQRAQVMVEQYNQYAPVDTMRVNGELTLGENIADLAGLTVAYDAYQLALAGRKAPVIDGFTGEQRFFLGWAQVWRRKYRDDELRRRLLTDPHSPSEYRTNGIVSNMPEFYAAFDVKPVDPMYRPDTVRVKIW